MVITKIINYRLVFEMSWYSLLIVLVVLFFYYSESPGTEMR
jgi:hypothetical protein